MAGTQDTTGYEPCPQPPHRTYPYSPSSTSTASPTSSLASSVDAPSSQSSVSSSIGCSNTPWHNENEDPSAAAQHSLQRQDSISSDEGSANVSCTPCYGSRWKQPGEVASSTQQHPRRTQPFKSYESQDGKQINQCPRPPPSLVRQSERKENFVGSLVGKLTRIYNIGRSDHADEPSPEDTSTQMLETIWPLSVLSCGRDTALGAKRQNLLGLRTFVEEVLKRSKTSYSTLQVALYYLILIQSCLPRHDLTMEQLEDSGAYRAMQCGRRMFLAALILASKYLQDRNFSARAWSKISGLSTSEINANELAFLSAVQWKLHVPKEIFERWENIVMRYSPSAQVHSPPRSLPAPTYSWKSLIPLLTPELDGDFLAQEMDTDSGYDSAGSDAGSDLDSVGSDTSSDMGPPPLPVRDEAYWSGSNEPTPKPSYTIPKTLEPTPRDTNCDSQILPPMPSLGGLLPTPQMTPQTGTFGTPAVSASAFCFKKPSMSYAMSQLREKDLARSTLDGPREWQLHRTQTFPTSSRRSSLARSSSTISSPESMVSDRSSRSSRSSSISSVASSTCALLQPRLAVQAAHRCAKMQLCGLQEESGRSTPTQGERDTTDSDWVEYCEATYPGYQKPVVKMPAQLKEMLYGERRLERAETQTAALYIPQREPVPFPEFCVQGPKYHLSCSNNYSADHASTQEAAAALHDLALNRQNGITPPPSSLPQSGPRASKTLKRPRPLSIDLSNSATQSMVRASLAGSNEDDSTVLVDENVADSFMLRKENTRPSGPLRILNQNKQPKPSMSREDTPCKRTCAGSDRGGKGEARMYERSVSNVLANVF